MTFWRISCILGAGIGAAVGSIIPGVGTAIGAVVGGIIGDNNMASTAYIEDVYIQTNNAGEYKKAEFLNYENTTDGYRENYIFREDNMLSASLKIDVVTGTKWTAIKRPTLIFKIDTDTIE